MKRGGGGGGGEEEEEGKKGERKGTRQEVRTGSKELGREGWCMRQGERGGGGVVCVCEIERTQWVKCANSRQKTSVLYM